MKRFLMLLCAVLAFGAFSCSAQDDAAWGDFEEAQDAQIETIAGTEGDEPEEEGDEPEEESGAETEGEGE